MTFCASISPLDECTFMVEELEKQSGIVERQV